MTSTTLAREFAKIFASKIEERDARMRGQKTGRVDSRRTARIMNGTTNIFQQTDHREKSGQTVGSLAITTTMQDAFGHWLAKEEDGKESQWAYTLRMLQASAEAVGIPCRLIASNWKPGIDENALDTIITDNAEELINSEGRNSWPRGMEAIKLAKTWHQTLPGRSITFHVTAYADIKNGEVNDKEDLFRKWAKEEAQVMKRIIDGTETFMITTFVNSKYHWGMLKKLGQKAVCDMTTPGAARYNVENQQDLVSTLRRVSQRVA